VSPAPFPAPGPDGDEPPLPGDAARDDDFGADADLARLLAGIESGEVPVPSEDELRAMALMSAVGTAGDVDPVVLAAMAGPDGLGGQAFAQEQVADVMPPGPLLAVLAESAAADVVGLSDDAVLGVISAARRLAARAEYLELTAVAEFTARRQAQLAASAARKEPRGQRAGEFADAELGMHLLISRIRQESLAAKAAALEVKLDPEAARARKEHARREGRRVEARREMSGNMSFGARELAVEDALAVNAAVEAAAAALRRAGLDGTLRDLRVMCFLDRLLGRNPLDRLPAPAPADNPASADPAAAGSPAGGPAVGDPDSDPAPFPALVNLLVPAGTAFGWSTAPGEAGRWGLLDPWDTRRLLQAASRHPRTRWCVTAVGPDGTAVAHGCSRGPHRWTPAPPPTVATPSTTGPGTTGPGTTRPPPPGPEEHQRAQLAELLRALNITWEPIAKKTCDHRHREDRYTPSRRLGHLVRARTATCPAPGCGASAHHADLDHTTPWPQGHTDECNISPPCRRHHRVKQAPGWKLEQTSPGVMRWTGPSGRTYVTGPTVYDAG
jgi:hypothetical protein